MKTDNKTLLDNVERSFELSVNAEIPREEQKQYEARGFELRARLMTLLTAEFANGTKAVTDANAKIKEVNTLLKNRLKSLQSAAATVAALGNLVTILDDLFKLPFSFS
jgi:hypothetical protein